MNAPRSSILTTSHSRRGAVRTGGALAAALVAADLGRAAAQEATPVPGAVGTGMVFVQSFSSGSLFWTQGSSPDLPPYTLYLWDVAERTVFFAEGPERATGLVPTDRFLDTLMITADDATSAVLVARSEDSTGAGGGDEMVWALRLVFGGLGSDPGAATYQGDLIAAAETAAQFGVTPAPAPEGSQTLGGGYLFMTGVVGFDLGDSEGVQVGLS